MNTVNTVYFLWLASALLWKAPCSAQGTFRNLDFELAQIPQSQPVGDVSTAAALPFWAVYYGATQALSEI